MSSVKGKDGLYVAHTYARFPLEIVKGEGAYLTDSEGNTYIDMGSGIAVNTLGHSDPLWIEAVEAQLHRFQHTSNLYYTEPCVRLAELLCEKTGAKKVFFSNSGAEANECAIKAARKYAAAKKGRDCFEIITLKNSFHGRTVTTLAATGQDVFHRDFTPLTEGFVYAQANSLDSVRACVSDRTAAIMVEAVQGEGGVLPLTVDFVQGIAALCREKDILLIFDEVQTGNGRTGTLYAYEQFSVTPDIVTTAKGLGGGLPIGATLLFEKTEGVFVYGDHGSTFGGNPVVCAGALSVLSRMDGAFLSQVSEKSRLIFETLQGAKGIRCVSGMGLMIGFETEKDPTEVLACLRQRGVLALKAKNKIRLLPPLNIPKELLFEALAVIVAVCAEA